MNVIKSFLRVIGYLLAVHILCLLALSICRIVLLVANIPDGGIDWSLLPTSMLIGLKFDNLIAGYVTALPALIMPVFALATMHRKESVLWMQRFCRCVTWYYGIVYALLLFIHVANARYFHFFGNHLNIGVTAWFGFVEDTAGMLLEDRTNWYFFLIAVIIIALYEYVLVCVYSAFAQRWLPVQKYTIGQYVLSSFLTILLWGVVFCSMRGSFQRYPLNVSFAYFSNNPFYNKLGVNPVFNIIKTAEHGMDKVPEEIAAIDERDALAYVQQELGFVPTDTILPVVRKGSVNRRIEGQPNVVVIFMESMAAENLEGRENGMFLTPYLRSLREKSIYWKNCYSTGIHTNNGIVGVHYGYVPNFAKPVMDVNADIYTGLPYYLRKNGYETLCFVTGNPQYDNMNSFWRDNHINEIYSLYDYESDSAVNNFGVSDGYMFRYGLRRLETYAADGKPFFASFLTVSNHGPYVVPEAYKNRAEKPQDQIIAYADDAIRMFMEAAQHTEWGKNTLFILVADHGTSYPSPYEMVYSYNRIPVFITGAGITPEILATPASQIDIWPTVLSMLGIDYSNNCLGVDVLNESRKYAFFVSDDHLGVSDGEYFWCYGIHTKRECLYRVGNGENIIFSEPEKAAVMRAFGMNMQRVNLLAIDKKWTVPCE